VNGRLVESIALRLGTFSLSGNNLSGRLVYFGPVLHVVTVVLLESLAHLGLPRVVVV